MCDRWKDLKLWVQLSVHGASLLPIRKRLFLLIISIFFSSLEQQARIIILQGFNTLVKVSLSWLDHIAVQSFLKTTSFLGECSGVSAKPMSPESAELKEWLIKGTMKGLDWPDMWRRKVGKWIPLNLAELHQFSHRSESVMILSGSSLPGLNATRTIRVCWPPGCTRHLPAIGVSSRL